MAEAFTDLEGLRIAVDMEKRGEDFYRRAARVSKSPEMVALLNELAADEVGHAREFQRLADRAAGEEGEAYDAETSAYLSAIAADIAFPGGLMALRGTGF